MTKNEKEIKNLKAQIEILELKLKVKELEEKLGKQQTYWTFPDTTPNPFYYTVNTTDESFNINGGQGTEN